MFDGLRYHNYLDLDNCRVSLDNIRIRFRFSDKIYDFDFKKTYETLAYIQKLLSISDIHGDAPGSITWYIRDSFKIGSYGCTGRVDYKISPGDSCSFAILIGRFAFGVSKQMVPEVVLDVNPNKVPWDVLSWYYNVLATYAKDIDVVRFDLAFDYPVSRSDVFLVQDHTRGYKQFRGRDGFTEYQGERHSNGAVKVYDKTAESDLPVPVTRVEITVHGDYTGQLSKLYPEIHGYLSSGQLDFDLGSLPFAVQACLLYPDLIEILRTSVSRNTYKSHLEMIRQYDKQSLSPKSWSAVDSWLSIYLSVFRSGRL